MRALLLAIALLATPPSPVLAQEASLPPPPVTPADLNVGCYLFVRNTSVPKDEQGRNLTYSAETCGVVLVTALGLRSGSREGQTNFCLPDTAEVDANPAYAMAYAYLDFYKANSPRITTTNGPGLLVVALAQKWPCP